MPNLRVKIKLNKGRHGIPLHTLADIAKEAQKFLEQFGKDLKIGEGEWIAEKFKNGSLSFDLINPAPEASEPVLHQAYQALKHITDVKTSPDALEFGLKKATFLQYARMALPLDDDDALEVGIYNGLPRPKIRKLSKLRAVTIQKQILNQVRQYGGVQGRILALFNGSYGLWVHDFLSNQRVVCSFPPNLYDQVVKMLETRDAIVQVEGWFTTDQLGEPAKLEILSIQKSPDYVEGDIDKFFGCDPDFTGEMTTEGYIESLRM